MAENPFGIPVGPSTGESGPVRGYESGGPERPEEARLTRSIMSKASKTLVFGQNLAGMTGHLLGVAGQAMWDNKREIMIGGGLGFAVRTATRAMLAGTGGWVAVGAAGAAAGTASGVYREYAKQKKVYKEQIGQEEAGKHATNKELEVEIKRRLKAEFRGAEVDRRKIVIAAVRGGVIGAAGALAGAEFLEWAGHNETVQGIWSPVGTKLQEGWVGAGGLIKEHFSGPAGEAPAATLPPSPTASPTVLSHAPAMSEVPTNVPSAALTPSQIIETPVPIGTPVPTDTPIPTEIPKPAATSFVPTETPTPVPTHAPVLTGAPEIKPMPESIKLPSGSNPWNEMQKYLTKNLGRTPEPEEVSNAVTRVLSENNITDATQIPAGTPLKLSGVNDYLGHVLENKPPVPTGTPDLGHALPDSTPPAGPDALPAPLPIEHPVSIPPTEIHGHLVSGSVIDNNLTYDGKPWVLLENGTKNIGHLFDTAGETSPINQQALAANLQQAANLWVHGQLDPSSNPDLYALFHLSNGTASIYNNLLDDDEDTLKSLIRLGIVSK